MVVAEPSPSAAYEGVSKELPVTAISLDTALENLGIGWFQYRLLFMCGLNFMADSIEVSLLSFVSVCVGVQWSLTQIELASITSTVFAGALISSVFIWGYVADTYGRRIAFMSGCLLISIGGICTALSPNLYVLLISLFMVGMGNGCIFVPFDLLAEFLPANSRGYFLIVINYFWTMGSILVAGFAWLLLDIAGWRALALVSALPVGIACVLSVLYLPESPRWLLLKGRTSEAVAVLNEAAEVNGISLGDFVLDVPDPLACGQSNLVEESGSAETTAETEVVSSSNESGEEESTRWMDLLENPVRWVTLSLWVTHRQDEGAEGSLLPLRHSS